MGGLQTKDHALADARATAPEGACFVVDHSSIVFPMTEKEMVLKTVRELPDDCSLDEIADRIEFLAAVQKGLDQLDRGEGSLGV